MSLATRTPPHLALSIPLAFTCGCGVTTQVSTKDTEAVGARAAFPETLVYDNSDNATGSFSDILPSTKIGDVVTIDGPGRRLTRMEFLLGAWSMPNDSVRPLVRVQLRSLGRSPDRPGPPFWQSRFQRVVLPDNAETPIAFRLPGVRVPQTFVWTLDFWLFDQFAEAPEVVYAGPATVGDDNPNEAGFWIYYPWWPGPGWGFSTRNARSFYCRIYAYQSRMQASSPR